MTIEGITRLPLSDVKIGSKLLTLKEPIYLDVVYENDNYILSNDKLHLRAEEPSLKAAMEDINKETFMPDWAPMSMKIGL